MKLKNKAKVSVIKMILSDITYASKDAKGLTDDGISSILLKHLNKRKDSVEQYRKGDRQDLVAQEEEEMKIIQE